ncbi:MAG: DUF3795 domain-containing protein [Bacteroidia bacterium]|nr:DUF3795 domain-containing protein [Bacteroidia bacterium]
MEKFISCCGLDCATCDARIATISNDDALRKATAEKWAVKYKAPDFTAEMINCLGCRQDGVKIGHCYECEIRNCAIEKGFVTCGSCPELDTCSKVAGILSFVPDARENLRQMSLQS